MGNNEEQGYPYAGIIISKWVDIISLREEFRTQQIIGQNEPETTNTYIAKLTSLWLELQPLVKGRSELGDLKTEFESFEKYYFDPQQLSPQNEEDKHKAEDIYKLEKCLRNVIAKLGITDV